MLAFQQASVAASIVSARFAHSPGMAPSPLSLARQPSQPGARRPAPASPASRRTACGGRGRSSGHPCLHCLVMALVALPGPVGVRDDAAAAATHHERWSLGSGPEAGPGAGRAPAWSLTGRGCPLFCVCCLTATSVGTAPGVCQHPPGHSASWGQAILRALRFMLGRPGFGCPVGAGPVTPLPRSASVRSTLGTSGLAAFGLASGRFGASSVTSSTSKMRPASGRSP